MTKSYGKERVEAACARAVHFGAFSYRNVKTMLEKGLDRQPLETETLLPLEHSNVRGATYYAGGQICAN